MFYILFLSDKPDCVESKEKEREHLPSSSHVMTLCAASEQLTLKAESYYPLTIWLRNCKHTPSVIFFIWIDVTLFIYIATAPLSCLRWRAAFAQFLTFWVLLWWPVRIWLLDFFTVKDFRGAAFSTTVLEKVVSILGTFTLRPRRCPCMLSRTFISSAYQVHPLFCVVTFICYFQSSERMLGVL